MGEAKAASSVPAQGNTVGKAGVAESRQALAGKSQPDKKSPWIEKSFPSSSGSEEKYSLPPRASERRFTLRLKKDGGKKE
jgi:hypothetical protein